VRAALKEVQAILQKVKQTVELFHISNYMEQLVEIVDIIHPFEEVSTEVSAEK